MKKILIIVSIFIYLFSFLPIETLAATKTQVAEISKIENELYGFDYINEEMNKRLSRLEKTIYGKESSGDISKRLKRIAMDINSEQIGLEITPSEDTFREDEAIADSTVNYPIVDEIEMKLFKKTYKNRDFHTRIVTIERELFGKIYDVEDYSKRMDRIKAEVVPERLAREKVFGYDNTDETLNSIDLSGLNNNRFAGRMPYGQENYTRPYSNYGDYTGGASPMPENLGNELAQLEYNTFGTEFSNEDTASRIKRLNSVNKAKKSSSRYDSAKFQQRMSTAMEIGAMLLMILAMVL
ncbi:hypothetical protein IJ384_00110 [bacterium]|nr:hypothetical protein [bacterium]